MRCITEGLHCIIENKGKQRFYVQDHECARLTFGFPTFYVQDNLREYQELVSSERRREPCGHSASVWAVAYQAVQTCLRPGSWLEQQDQVQKPVV